MLLAVSAHTSEAALEIVRRISLRFGPPDALLEQHTQSLASWNNPGQTQVDASAGWVLEGAIDWGAEATPTRLAEARGDYALMAHQLDGILLGSSVAGGFRPIYVARLPSGTIVASTRLAAVLMTVDDRTSLDLDAVCAGCIVQAVPQPDATPYRAIRQVPMGEGWLIRAGREPHRSSTERPYRQETLTTSARDYTERMRAELRAAVRRATRGTERVAVSVSGGVDSGTVLSLLSYERRETGAVPPFDAFAITFDAPPQWDDRPFRRSLSERWSLPIFEIDPAASPLSKAALRSYLVVDGLPCRAIGLPLAAEIARLAQLRGSRVLLTGEGGDDVLNGQPGFYGDLLREGRCSEAVRGVWGLHAVPWRSFPRLRSLLQLRTVLSPFEPVVLRHRRSRRNLLSSYPWAGPRLRRFLGQVAAKQPSRLTVHATPEERYWALRSLRAFTDSARFRAQEEVVGGHVRRDPFFDDEFLRFVASIPPLMLLHGGYKRGLLRESMRGILPESLRLRQTKSFIEPAFVRMTAAARGVHSIEDLVDVRMLADLGIVEPKPFRAHYEHVATRPADRGWVYLWAFAATEAFLRFNAEPGASGSPWN